MTTPHSNTHVYRKGYRHRYISHLFSVEDLVALAPGTRRTTDEMVETVNVVGRVGRVGRVDAKASSVKAVVVQVAAWAAVCKVDDAEMTAVVPVVCMAQGRTVVMVTRGAAQVWSVVRVVGISIYSLTIS